MCGTKGGEDEEESDEEGEEEEQEDTETHFFDPCGSQHADHTEANALRFSYCLAFRCLFLIAC